MEALLEAQKDSGEIPPALLRRPKLEEHERFYFDAFSDLSSCRAQGETVGSIPYSEFRDWCDDNDVVKGFKRQRLWKYLRAMDDTYVKFVLERRKQEMEKSKSQR